MAVFNLQEESDRVYPELDYSPAFILSGSPVIGPGRTERPVPAQRIIGKLEQVRADVRGEPIATRSRAPGGEQGRWVVDLEEDEEELEGIAKGPGITKGEALAQVINWLSWTWAPIFTGAVVAKAMASMSIHDILPGLQDLFDFSTDVFSAPLQPWRFPGGPTGF